jgi:hypothetical protein
MTRGLRLLAQDAEDLEIISAALQDAVAKVGDIDYDPRGRTLTIAFNRFRWETNGGRVRSALQLGGVQAVKVRNLKRGVKEAVVELLSLTFEAGEPPGGAVNLMFAGGGDLRCEVECIDAVLADVSRPWPTPRRPEHQT